MDTRVVNAIAAGNANRAKLVEESSKVIRRWAHSVLFERIERAQIKGRNKTKIYAVELPKSNYMVKLSGKQKMKIVADYVRSINGLKVKHVKTKYDILIKITWPNIKDMDI